MNSVTGRTNDCRERQLYQFKRMNINRLPKLALSYKPKAVRMVRQVKRWLCRWSRQPIEG